jgi:hypothetical protein
MTLLQVQDDFSILAPQQTSDLERRSRQSPYFSGVPILLKNSRAPLCRSMSRACVPLTVFRSLWNKTRAEGFLAGGPAPHP